MVLSRDIKLHKMILESSFLFVNVYKLHNHDQQTKWLS
jgi:hypothetical protein